MPSPDGIFESVGGGGQIGTAMLLARIRTASQKAQLQELQEAKVDEHANLMKERHDDLLRQLEEANAWIMELEQMPDWEEEPVVEVCMPVHH